MKTYLKCFFALVLFILNGRTVFSQPSQLVIQPVNPCVGTEFTIDAFPSPPGYYDWSIDPPGYMPFGMNGLSGETFRCDVPDTILNVYLYYYSPFGYAYNTQVYGTVSIHGISHSLSQNSFSYGCINSRDTFELFIQKDSVNGVFPWTMGHYVDSNNGQNSLISVVQDSIDTLTITASSTFNLIYQLCDSVCCTYIFESILIDSSLPIATFAYTQAGTTASFNAEGSSTQNYYRWSFGDGGTSSQYNPTHNYPGDGYYQTCLVVRNLPCGYDTTCTWVQFGCIPPVSNINLLSTSSTIQYQFTGSMGPNTQVTFDFGDGTVLTNLGNGYHTYSSPQVYNITLILNDSCGIDTFTTIIDLSCPPITQANFAFTTNYYSAQFTESSGIIFNPVHTWDFGDGTTSNLANPNHTYSSTGIYTVCHVITSPCGSDTFCQNVTIACPPPVAGFSYQNTVNAFQFYNSSTANQPQYFWDFGDGSSSTQVSPYHSYGAPGNYTVTLVLIDPCGTDTFQVVVSYACNPNVTVQSLLLNGLNEYQFTYNTNTPISNLNWNFGDGTNSVNQNPIHAYTQSGTFNVCLSGNTVCGPVMICDTVISICNQPIASFSVADSFNVVELASTSQGVISTYSWDFQSGFTAPTSSSAVTHIFASPGTYSICLAIDGVCGQDTICQSVPIACRNIQSSYSWTTLDKTVYLSTQITPPYSGYNFSWTWGNGQSTNFNAAYYVFPTYGTYFVCLNIDDGCATSSYCDSVTVSPYVSVEGSFQPNGFYLSPSPATNQITLHSPQFLPFPIEISIWSMDGRHLISKSINQSTDQIPLDISTIALGQYWLWVKTQSGNQILPFVKQ